ncbi:MAG: zinc-ribbon domain-containing protein [Polyangiaceae bacterium]
MVAGSTRIVWWKCPGGDEHVWASSLRERTRDRSGCPFCKNLRVSRTNSLGALEPEIAAEWHEARNALSAWDVPSGSSRRVWWRCARDPSHEWCVAIASRVQHRSGCPICAGKKVTLARSLAKRAPAIAKEWHPTKNGELRPSQVSVGSSAPIWWRCANGHEWRAPVSARTGPRHRGCARCSRARTKATRRRRGAVQLGAGRGAPARP